MTYIQLINSVLRRLREEVIDPSTSWSGSLQDSTTIDDYQKLIGDFVNEVKQEVENSWNWTSLRTVTTVDTVASTRAYELDGLTQRAKILGVYHSDGTPLYQISDVEMQKKKLSNTETGKPSYYSYRGSVGGDLQIELDALPDAVYTITVHAVDSQEDLSLATDVMTIPEWPVILGTWARAIAERGEDGGTLSDLAVAQYASSLSDHIAMDVDRTHGEDTWYVS